MRCPGLAEGVDDVPVRVSVTTAYNQGDVVGDDSVPNASVFMSLDTSDSEQRQQIKRAVCIKAADIAGKQRRNMLDDGATHC